MYSKSKRVYTGLLDRAYSLLGPGGRLVTNVPAPFKPYLDELEKTCHTNNIEFRKERIPPYSELFDGQMMLQKNENSPSILMNILTKG